MAAPRYAAHRDHNQTPIVKALKKYGVSVVDLAAVGGGCPDLLTSYKGRTVLMEIKNPERYGKQRKPQEHQAAWMNNWQGETAVIETWEQALGVYGIEVN